jgi:hypothetical protein
MESRREKLKVEIQERIQNIQYNIARLESQIISATDEKKIHEDLQFHLQLLDELGRFEAESEEKDEAISIEVIEPQPK